MMRNDREKNVIYRKWNGVHKIPLSWRYTGSFIDMTLINNQLTIRCPVILTDISILPFNSCLVIPTAQIFVDEYDIFTYENADIYPRDPCSPEYLVPITRVTPVVTRTVTEPVTHQFVSTCTSCPVPVSNKKGLPQHVAKLILADSISKNEDCPISCEAITMANGSVTSCGHVFSKASIDEWFKLKDECPVCKQTCV
jgi:hypothetical protein